MSEVWPIPAGFVPRLRPGLRLEGSDEPPHVAVLCDDTLALRFRLDRKAHRIVRAIDGKRDLAALLRRLSPGGSRRVTRAELCRVVAFLDAAALLEDPVSASGDVSGEAGAGHPWMHAAGEAAAEGTPELALQMLPGARFGCQRTGMCCAGYTVGPVEAEVVQAVRAHSFQGNPALLNDTDPFEEVPADGGGTVLVLRQQDSRCVFLDAGLGCLIHQEIGEHAKPAICRAYPYTFTATPDGSCWVGLNMECGGYAAARELGPPVSDQEATFRELLGRVAPFRVAEPLTLEAGRTLTWGRYAALEERWLETLRETGQPAFRQARELCHSLEEVRSGQRATEFAPNALQWPAAADDDARILLQSVLRRCTVAARRSFADGHVLSAEMLVRVRVAAGLLLELPDVVGEDLWPRATQHFSPRPGAATDPRWDPLLRDLLVYAVFGKQLLRTPTLVAGLGLLVLRLWLGSALAAVVVAHTRAPRLEAAHVNEGLRTVNRVLREDSVGWLDPGGERLGRLVARLGGNP